MAAVRRALTTLGLAVLELLHERPMHPYEMAQLMRERHVDVRVKVKAGSLYHTVERLEADGYVEVVDTQREGRRPERTVYGMTCAGRDAFAERALGILGTVAEEYPEFTSGLAVLDDLDREDTLAELRRRALSLEASVAADTVITSSLHERELPEIYWLDWRFIAAKRRFELEWTKQLIDDISSGRLAWQPAKKCKPGLSLVDGDTTTDGGPDEHQAS